MNQRSTSRGGEHDLDTLGLVCPEPVFRVRKRLASMRTGAILRVLTDDPLAELDLAAFCQRTGHELIESRVSGGVRITRIRKTDGGRESIEPADGSK